MKVSPHEIIEERSRRILEELNAIEDRIDRYQHLVELGERIPRLAESDRNDDTRLRGCQYGVWIRSDYDPTNGVLRFRVDSDARIVRGLAAVIVYILDGLPPATILDADLDFLNGTGLQSHLSVQRSNGLAAMIHEMRARASQYAEVETE